MLQRRCLPRNLRLLWGLHYAASRVFACTGCRSRQVLECDADTLILGVPGLALPDSALATALLPSVPDMVDASLRCSRLAQKVAKPASATPEGQPDNAAGELAHPMHPLPPVDHVSTFLIRAFMGERWAGTNWCPVPTCHHVSMFALRCYCHQSQAHSSCKYVSHDGVCIHVSAPVQVMTVGMTRKVAAAVQTQMLKKMSTWRCTILTVSSQRCAYFPLEVFQLPTWLVQSPVCRTSTIVTVSVCAGYPSIITASFALATGSAEACWM